VFELSLHLLKLFQGLFRGALAQFLNLLNLFLDKFKFLVNLINVRDFGL
jgi:hypothetical protein